MLYSPGAGSPDLIWNTTLIYSLFPNTLLMLQGDHVELARIFPTESRTDRAVMELALYVPKVPTTEQERSHWDKNMQLVLDVVTDEDFPAGRTIQIGLTSGAQTARDIRPQRAGHDPLSPVDAGCSRPRFFR